MQKTTAVKYSSLALMGGLVLLTGCDLLGLGPKKQEPAKEAAPVSISAQAVSTDKQSVTGPIPADILVRIGQWTLTQQDFTNRLTLLKQQIPGFKENDSNAKVAVLDELVRQQLLVQEAEDSDLGNTKEVKDAIEDFRKTLLVQEIASRLTKNILVTEDDAKTYYDTHKNVFTQPVTWTVRQIVVADEATAKNILVQVLQGGDFAQLAQTQSKASNAAIGGKLKPFTLEKAPFDAMKVAIYNLEEGGVSGVFKGPEGYYIVKVDTKAGGSVKAFADIKKELIYELTLQKQQGTILSHLNELAQKTKPEYNKSLVDQVIGAKTQTVNP